ncbi:flagellar motor switch protein FliN [Nocardioides sp.]|uniref:flagellar motor switch protein FliN n=1 Tax=Nocardioides sp. TaxID=35761 RepID=UPI002B2700C4|nr:flagellar motor switch protein FliN [Nocardioides sp.]
MTVDATLSPAATPAGVVAGRVAEACLAVLPSAEPLTVGEAQPGSAHVVQAFAGAATATLTGAVTGQVTVLVGEELVAALAGSPIGGLDLAAAVQPALDAIAAALGAGAQVARGLPLELVVGDLGGPFTAVPLLGAGLVAAVLIPDATLAQATPATAGHGTHGTAPVTPAERPDLTGLAQPGTPEPQRAVSLSDGRRGLEMLHGVELEVTVELGRTRMPVRDLLALTPGAVLSLDRAAGSPADLLVNGRLIARGEVVVVDEDFGLRVTEIIDQNAAG